MRSCAHRSGARVDLTWSAEEDAFRAEARAWLETNLAEWRAEHGGEPASGDTREGFAQHLDWERRLFADRWAVVSWPEEHGGRGRLAVGVAAVRGGVLPGRGAAAGDAERHLPARAEHLRVRHARAAGRDPRGAWPPPRTCGARAGRSPTPAATSPASPARPGGSTAAGCSTARRRGPPAARSAPTSSACSAPTRTARATRASPTSWSRSTRPASRCAASAASTATRASPRCSSTTPSSPTTPSPAAWCSGSPRAAGRSRWPRPAPSAASRCARPAASWPPPSGSSRWPPSGATPRCGAAPPPRGCTPTPTSSRRWPPSPGWPTGAKPGRRGQPHQAVVERARHRAAPDRPRPARPRGRARGAVEQGLAVRAVGPDLRGHQRDPAQHRRRARPGAPPMRFALSDDQVAFRDAARELLAKECHAGRRAGGLGRAAGELDRGVWDSLDAMGVLGAARARGRRRAGPRRDLPRADPRGGRPRRAPPPDRRDGDGRGPAARRRAPAS